MNQDGDELVPFKSSFFIKTETRRVNREAIIQLYELEIAESERINDSLYNLSKINESFTNTFA